MRPDWISYPTDVLDGALAGGLHDTGLVVVLVLAVALGLRHATDPDHLAAVIALVAAEGADPRAAARMGAWWGCGHAAVLLGAGMPLVLLDARFPGWVQSAAEHVVGAVIVALSLRVLLLWRRRRRRTPAHARQPGATVALGTRTARQAAGIGVLHGLGGTGAVVLLFTVQLPTTTQAAVALSAFAPMTVVSMTLCTRLYAWALTRPALAAPGQAVVAPVVAVASLVLGGCWALG